MVLTVLSSAKPAPWLSHVPRELRPPPGHPCLRLLPLRTKLPHRCLAGHPLEGVRPLLTLTSSGNSSPTRAMIRDVFPTWARKEREDVGTGPAEPERLPRSEPAAGANHTHGAPGQLGPRASRCPCPAGDLGAEAGKAVQRFSPGLPQGAYGKGPARRNRQIRGPAGLATASGGHCYRGRHGGGHIPRPARPARRPGQRAGPAAPPRPAPPARPSRCRAAPRSPPPAPAMPPPPALPSPRRRMRTSRFMAAPPPPLPGPPRPPPATSGRTTERRRRAARAEQRPLAGGDGAQHPREPASAFHVFINKKKNQNKTGNGAVEHISQPAGPGRRARRRVRPQQPAGGVEGEAEA